MLWQVIASNKRKAVLLVLAMGIALALLGFCIGELVDGFIGFTSGHTAASLKAGFIGLVFALIFWFSLLLTSIIASDQIFLSLAGAKEVTHELYPQLYNIVEEMKLASSLPAMPAIYIIDDPAPNAFAVGKSPESSSICVTAGLLALCNRDELQGVVAHEMGHILNRDTLYLTIAATMLGAATIIADSFIRSLRFAPAARYRSSSSSSAKGGGLIYIWLMVIAFIFVLLSPLLSRILYFAVSRSREYLADATSARLTKYPEGLASALEKILRSPEKLTTASRATAPFYISNPFRQNLDGGMFATHPPLNQRIKILRSMGTGAAYKDYLKAYWNVTHTHKAIIPETDFNVMETIAIREPSPGHVTEAGQGPTRAAGDIMRAMHNYVFINCECGMKMKVPPEFARGELRCPRCNRQHLIEEVERQGISDTLNSSARFTKDEMKPVHPDAAGGKKQVQEVARKPHTWQVFTCNGCGKPVQISSALDISHIFCPTCGQLIQFM